jgi:hypothetical protein
LLAEFHWVLYIWRVPHLTNKMWWGRFGKEPDLTTTPALKLLRSCCQSAKL